MKVFFFVKHTRRERETERENCWQINSFPHKIFSSSVLRFWREPNERYETFLSFCQFYLSLYMHSLISLKSLNAHCKSVRPERRVMTDSRRPVAGLIHGDRMRSRYTTPGLLNRQDRGHPSRWRRASCCNPSETVTASSNRSNLL
jgi:hypothetical protein